jgi:hypothetical protein
VGDKVKEKGAGRKEQGAVRGQRSEDRGQKTDLIRSWSFAGEVARAPANMNKA